VGIILRADRAVHIRRKSKPAPDVSRWPAGMGAVVEAVNTLSKKQNKVEIEKCGMQV